MKFFSFVLITVLILGSEFVSGQVPAVFSGTIKRFENFQSKYVTSRNIDVWLPGGFTQAKKYNVLYMHDGQALYDSAITWNHQAWDVDDVITTLTKEAKIKDVIVVGVWNGGATRWSDYFPQKAFDLVSAKDKEMIQAIGKEKGEPLFSDKVNSDNYLRFLVEEVKTMIDKNFPVYKDAGHTFVMGSSMGGLISMYAICEYPKVFGGAGCLSTHWPGIFPMENNPVPAAFIDYMKKALPKPRTHKIYFDHGTAMLDASYPELQKKVDKVMIEKGFTAANWMTLEFPGEDHSEKAWKKRLDVPLLFLLGKN